METSVPHLVDVTSMYDLDQSGSELQHIHKYRIDYLPPTEKIRFDLLLGTEMAELGVSAASSTAVAFFEWEHANSAELQSKAWSRLEDQIANSSRVDIKGYEI